MENFVKIYNQLSGRVYNFALSALGNSTDAKDILQQTFLKFWENRAKIREDENYTAYIFTIARNLIYDELRGRVVLYSLQEEKIEISNLTAPDEQIYYKQQQERAIKIIEQLPEQRRKIFIMRKIDNMSYKEISVKLGISENTIDTQLKRSMAFLKENMKDFKIFFIFV